MAVTSAPQPIGASHPIHVILAAYPIACFTGAFLTDIVYAKSTAMMWANFSVWLITAGLVMGAAAAIVGIVDYAVTRRPRPRMTGHSLMTVLALLLALVNAFVHSRDAYTSVVPSGLILSGITALLILISSWMGSSATYAAVRGVR